MSKLELSNLIRDYLVADKERKQAELKANALRDQIKQEMESLQVEELTIDEHIVRFKEVLTSIFDTTSFKNQFGFLYTQFLKQVPTKKFSVS